MTLFNILLSVTVGLGNILYYVASCKLTVSQNVLTLLTPPPNGSMHRMRKRLDGSLRDRAKEKVQT